MKKATIRDVAQEAGVSIATASNALNNPSIVKPHTRQAVLDAVSRLSYVPNANGQRLRAKQSKAIGLFVNSMAGEFYGILADTMNQVCRSHGYELDIRIVYDINSIRSRLQDHSIDGAVIYWDAVDDLTAAELMSTDFPLMFLARREYGRHTSSMLLESRKHGAMAAEYLYGLGKRSFLHIYGLSGNYDSEMRCEGFLEVLEGHGLNRNDVRMFEGRFEREAAYREMKQYLQSGNPLPDAIFASNDLSGIGCMAALREMGIRIPEDVSIIGCDDISLCAYTTPGLTTIRTHFQDIGTIAAQEVFRLIQGEPGRLIHQDGVLVERGSCSPSDHPA